MNVDAVKSFLGFFGPDEKMDQVTDDLVEEYKDKLPEEILVLWVNFGFGNFGGGILKLIDPSLFKQNLDKWLDDSYLYNTPFMITAFGDIFYYRKGKEGDAIYLLSVHYKKVKKCANSIEEFLTGYIKDRNTIGTDLRANLYLEAEKTVGKLDGDTIYVFVPSIQFGGKEEVKYIQKADAYIYQNILLGD